VSEVSDVAIVRMLMADYASVDTASKKLNIVGGGVAVLGAMASTGVTAPFGLAVTIAVPATHYEAECNVEIILEDAAGNPVSLASSTGETQPVRMGQRVKFDTPELPQEGSPKGYLPARALIALAFAIGLPLAVDQGYGWRLKIDDVTRADWTEAFVVVSQEVIAAQLGPTPS
jgi:hypothetical protein